MYSDKQILMSKDNLIAALGILIPGSVSIYTFIEWVKPVLGIVGLIVSIGVGVTIFILNIKKIQRVNQDKHINDIILKHPEIEEKRGKKGG